MWLEVRLTYFTNTLNTMHSDYNLRHIVAIITITVGFIFQNAYIDNVKPYCRVTDLVEFILRRIQYFSLIHSLLEQ